MGAFVLDPKLAADTVHVADWPLSRLCLMNDARFPWLILVPRRAEIMELHRLSRNDGLALMEELQRAGAGLQKLTGAAKINVAALGNLVTQLHVHIVARNPGDAAWPGPVWGSGLAVPYAEEVRQVLIARLATEL